MSRENFTVRIEYALQAFVWADQILEDAEGLNAPKGGGDHEQPAPWEAAQALVCKAMCLLIDQLDGVETATYASEEAAPVPKRIQPYSYLSARHATRAERCNDHARGLEDIFRDFDPHE